MDRTQHHERAEQLLSDARKEPDSFRRSLILAEAQVHATLALSAPVQKGPPGPGQSETRSTAATRGADPGRSEGGDDFDPQLHMPPGETSPGVSRQRETSSTTSTTEGLERRPWVRAAARGMGPSVAALPKVPPDPGDEAQILRQSTRPAEPTSPAPPTTPLQPTSPAPPTTPLPPDRKPARPRRRPRAEQLREQEPRDPDEEEPDDLGDQEPRGPEEPKPDPFRPF